MIIYETRGTEIRWSLTVGSLVSGLLLIVLFVIELERPLSHTDLWGHLAYGRYYEQNGFPDTEPFLKHSTEATLVPTSWMSQWLGFRIHQLGGAQALQYTHALLVTGVITTLLITLRRITNSHLTAFIGVAWFLWLEHQQYTVIRPQLAGLFCNLLFLNILLTQRHLTRWLMVALGVLSFCWANLHGSFVIALVTISLAIIGRATDICHRQIKRAKPLSGSTRSIVTDRRLQRLSAAFVVMLLASLLTPYGIKLWREVATFSQSSNLYDLIEWKPLWRTPRQGTVVLISTITLGIVLLVTRPPVRWELWLPVIVLGVLMVKTSRYIVWWAPLFVISSTSTLHLIARRSLPSRWRNHVATFLDRRITNGAVFLAIAVVVVGIVIPLEMISETPPDFSPNRSYSDRTPIDASVELNQLSTRIFQEHPDGLLFNTMEWGDWLIWSSEGQLPVFVYSHVPLIEEQAWRDYMMIIRQSEGWQKRWNSYPFRVALIDHLRHQELVASLSRDPKWSEYWRDERAVIFILTEDKPESLPEK